MGRSKVLRLLLTGKWIKAYFTGVFILRIRQVGSRQVGSSGTLPSEQCIQDIIVHGAVFNSDVFSELHQGFVRLISVRLRPLPFPVINDLPGSLQAS